ncbi:hypothetical protein BV898_19006 [Hypsibius exemplaris]|uniref:Uncharacterized protein n=1 Tax=Hypsibius exemplaris TaxID=2072580 RepID=A0A9X6RP26_HYPEX|nr:hypothetical protein BV898_19005 [Hypsibius exemplaris]OWA54607.1 hypothetical protein BV898_19006 [Hypsibius exemplaris]
MTDLCLTFMFPTAVGPIPLNRGSGLSRTVIKPTFVNHSPLPIRLGLEGSLRQVLGSGATRHPESSSSVGFVTRNRRSCRPTVVLADDEGGPTLRHPPRPLPYLTPGRLLQYGLAASSFLSSSLSVFHRLVVVLSSIPYQVPVMKLLLLDILVGLDRRSCGSDGRRWERLDLV